MTYSQKKLIASRIRFRLSCGFLAGVGFDAFAPAPEDEHFRAQFDALVDAADHLLQGVGAHLRVVRGERAILERRVGEQVGRRHRHFEPGVGQRLLEILEDVGGFGGRGVNRDQVVVVVVDAVSANFRQQMDDLDRRNRRCAPASPNGSRPVLPTVHRPKVNLSSGFGV